MLTSGMISGKVKNRQEMMESWSENGEMQQKQVEQMSQRWTGRVRLFSPCVQVVKWTQRRQSV